MIIQWCMWTLALYHTWNSLVHSRCRYRMRMRMMTKLDIKSSHPNRRCWIKSDLYAGSIVLHLIFQRIFMIFIVWIDHGEMDDVKENLLVKSSHRGNRTITETWTEIAGSMRSMCYEQTIYRAWRTGIGKENREREIEDRTRKITCAILLPSSWHSREDIVR